MLTLNFPSFMQSGSNPISNLDLDNVSFRVSRLSNCQNSYTFYFLLDYISQLQIKCFLYRLGYIFFEDCCLNPLYVSAE